MDRGAMFARHHQPPPNGVTSARIAQPVGISASSARASAAPGDWPLMSSTIAASGEREEHAGEDHWRFGDQRGRI